MTTYYAAFLRPGSRWDPEKAVREQPFWNERAGYMVHDVLVVADVKEWTIFLDARTG